MRDFALHRLVSSMVLLTTVFSMIAVDAFSSSLRYQKRQCIQQMDLFNGRGKKIAEVAGDDGYTRKNYGRRKRNGIIQKDIKKLDCLATKRKRNNYRYNQNNNGFRNLIAKRTRRLRQKIRQIIFRNTVYVLECEDNKYYVGSTKNKKKRYRQHFELKRSGSKWTKLHKPIRVFAEYNRIPSRYVLGMESQITAEYMMKYGVNNVRGASFCTVKEYTIDKLWDLTAFLGHYNQLNYRSIQAELKKVLPKSSRPYSQPPPRVFKATSETINKSKSNDVPQTKSELPEAVIRSKLRKSKRKEKKKMIALKRKNYIPSDGDQDNQTEDNDTSFQNRVDWTTEVLDD